MDFLDWTTYVAGGGLALLTGWLGLSRLSSAVEREIPFIWALGFICCGATLTMALVAGSIFPIDTIVYVANGGTTPRQVRIGEDVICLPGKSFADFTWRFFTPDAAIVGPGAGTARYPIGKGTWFINTSPVTVSADMYFGPDSVAYDALVANSSGAVHVTGIYGRPFRMFSQSSFDRIYSASGDVFERSTSGPCPAAPSAQR